MTEYGVILAFVLLSLMMRIPPWDKNVVELFVDAFHDVYDSFYVFLDLPFP